MRNWALALPAGLFALLAISKAHLLCRWLDKAKMTFGDLPHFWDLAAGNPPSRAFSAVEVVVLRQSTFFVQYLIASAVFTIAYLAARKRARAEEAIVAYCIELEEALKGRSPTPTFPDESHD